MKLNHFPLYIGGSVALKKILAELSNFSDPGHYEYKESIITLKPRKMEQRINFFQKRPAALKPLFALGAYLSKSLIERPLLNLVYFRVSQINGCAYCLDMHSKDLRAEGETEQRLHMIAAWREAPVYSDRERAALAWAEAVTTLTDRNVPDAVFEAARAEFSDEELIDLTMGVISINSYNRLNVAFLTPAGDYQPGQFAVHV